MSKQDILKELGETLEHAMGTGAPNAEKEIIQITPYPKEYIIILCLLIIGLLCAGFIMKYDLSLKEDEIENFKEENEQLQIEILSTQDGKKVTNTYPIPEIVIIDNSK